MSYSPKFTGSTSEAPSNSVGNAISNTSGSTIVRLTPVRIDGSGDVDSIDVAIESQAMAFIGVTDGEISTGNDGVISTSGRLIDITTTANNGDVLYVSKTGSMTNIKPDVGVGGFLVGDFVLIIGTVLKNADNPILQDLMLNINIVGQL